MEWITLYGPDGWPGAVEITGYINGPLRDEMNCFLQENYDVQPNFSYSNCSAQPGQNVRYQKAGRSLCTLYPMAGYFIALVVIGMKEEAEAEPTMPLCDRYTQELSSNTVFSAGGRWLMVDVTNVAILEDVKHLVQIRRKTRKKVQRWRASLR